MRPVDLQTAIANTGIAERAQQGTHPHQTEPARQAVAKHLQDEYEHRLEEIQKPEDPETEMVKEKLDKEKQRKGAPKKARPKAEDESESGGGKPLEHIDITA